MSVRLKSGDVCVPHTMKSTILILIAPLDDKDPDVLWMCLSNFGDIQWWYEDKVTRL